MLVCYQIGGSCVVLNFRNGLSLVIEAKERRVAWSVSSDGIVLSVRAQRDVVFELPSGTRFEWDWKETLDSFVGNEVSIFPSDQLLFLCVHGLGEFAVNVYVEE